MKITAIRGIMLRCTCSPISDALSTSTARQALLVKIETDAGLYGIGEAFTYGAPLKIMKYLVEEQLGPMLIGQDPTEIEKPVCPICQKEAKMNIVKTEGYLEEGYLPDWERYRKWLSCTLNKKLCILELGVGFQYPSVIRWPFEKTAFLNNKASFVRVNSKFFQLSEELKGKAISIPQNPLVLLKGEKDDSDNRL